MAKEGPDWQGLLKWSLGHADGTKPPRNLSDENRKWFMEAMQGQIIDIVKGMKRNYCYANPGAGFGVPGVTCSDIEGMLDELQEHVESIDMANAVQRLAFNL